MLVYDVSNRQSFDSVSSWMRDIVEASADAGHRQESARVTISRSVTHASHGDGEWGRSMGWRADGARRPTRNDFGAPTVLRAPGPVESISTFLGCIKKI